MYSAETGKQLASRFGYKRDKSTIKAFGSENEGGLHVHPDGHELVIKNNGSWVHHAPDGLTTTHVGGATHDRKMELLHKHLTITHGDPVNPEHGQHEEDETEAVALQGAHHALTKHG